MSSITYMYIYMYIQCYSSHTCSVHACSDTCTYKYTYNIIIIIFTGVLQADPGVIREHEHIYRLFCHECQRVFHDRLIDKTDKKYFYDILSEMSSKHFSKVSTYNAYTYININMLGLSFPACVFYSSLKKKNINVAKS